MLTFNLDTSDGLTNGALGEIVGYDISKDGKIQIVYVHFFDEKVGRDHEEGNASTPTCCAAASPC